METGIIYLKAESSPESLRLNEENLWFSSKKQTDLEKFKETVEKKGGGFLNSHGIVEYKNIIKIKMNESSKKVKVFYIDQKDKEQEIELECEEIEEAHHIGGLIAEKTELTKEITTENPLNKLLLNVLYVALAIGGTLFIGLMDMNEIDSGGSRKSRSGKAIISILHNTIGQTGIFIAGGIIAAYLAYQAYNRYKNPVNDIIFS